MKNKEYVAEFIDTLPDKKPALELESCPIDILKTIIMIPFMLLILVLNLAIWVGVPFLLISAIYTKFGLLAAIGLVWLGVSILFTVFD